MADPGMTSEKDSISVLLIRMILEMSEDRQRSLLKQLEQFSINSDDAASERDEGRKAFSQEITFISKNKTYKGVSQDISSGGMFIQTDQSFSVGQIILITIPYKNSDKSAKIGAEIARIKPDGIGVTFIKKQ